MNLSSKELMGILIHEDDLRYADCPNDYFVDEDREIRKPGIWDNFKIINTTILSVNINDSYVDYNVIVQHIPTGDYYSGEIREFSDEYYEVLCDELTEVFPTPITEIKYI